MNISDFDKAWAAGFFEGEGSVRISVEPSSRSLGVLRVEVSQVDPFPLKWLAARWPGTLHFIQPRAKGGRPFYRWCRITNDAVKFLEDIQPFLVRPQIREKAQIALAFQAQKIRTHENRAPEYRARQAAFAATMATLNRRGSIGEVERAALRARA